MVDNPETTRVKTYRFTPDILLQQLGLSKIDPNLRAELERLYEGCKYSQLFKTVVPEWQISVGQLIHVIDQSLLEVSLGNGIKILRGIDFVRLWLTYPIFLETLVMIDSTNLSAITAKINEYRMQIQSQHTA